MGTSKVSDLPKVTASKRRSKIQTTLALGDVFSFHHNAALCHWHVSLNLKVPCYQVIALFSKVSSSSFIVVVYDTELNTHNWIVCNRDFLKDPTQLNGEVCLPT